MAKPFSVINVVLYLTLPPVTEPEIGVCDRGHRGFVGDPCKACLPYIRRDEIELWERHYAPSTRRQALAHSIGIAGPGTPCRGCVRGE